VAEIEASFTTHMKAQSGISTLVGSRVYEFDAPSGARQPYIVVRPTTNVRGAFTQTQYGGVARLSAFVYAETIAKARAIGAVLLSTYQQFNGTLTDHTVQHTEVSNARTLFGPGDEFRYLVDIIFHFT